MTESEFRKKLAENLIKFRKINGLSQAELADCINYSNKSVSKWERGEGIPDIYILMNISEVFDITVSELIGQTDFDKKTKEKVKDYDKDKKYTEKAKKKALERAKKQKKKADK